MKIQLKEELKKAKIKHSPKATEEELLGLLQENITKHIKKGEK